MLVAGYAVLVFSDDISERSVMYGSFDTLDEALTWAKLLTGLVTVFPLYQPTHNRG